MASTQKITRAEAEQAGLDFDAMKASGRKVIAAEDLDKYAVPGGPAAESMRQDRERRFGR